MIPPSSVRCVNITDRGPNTVTIAFAATELLTAVNALEVALRAADATDADTYRRVQRPLVDALRTLRPKAQLDEQTGQWATDSARAEDGKHL